MLKINMTHSQIALPISRLIPIGQIQHIIFITYLKIHIYILSITISFTLFTLLILHIHLQSLPKNNIKYHHDILYASS
jgi:hypothetical protein